MLKYTTYVDRDTGHEWIETKLTGKSLLSYPLLNKGTAFTAKEREELKLLGKLPHRIETIEEQLERVRYQYKRYSSSLQKFIYLNNLHDKNEILFYKLLTEDLEETLPIIYTPVVGSAVKEFSHEFRHPRGIYIDYPSRDKIKQIFSNRTNPNIELMVVTDGEGILGIGDQGIGGMDIPIAKLVVYSLCGIDPYKTLPVMLDLGTDNKRHLKDPMYLGWRDKRVSRKQFDEFIEEFVNAVHEHFPNCFLHWEDLGRANARRVLEKYQTKHCMFNDDMQGTGVVTLAALLAAIGATNVPLENQRVVVFGAGTAGVGIADQLCSAMIRQGIPEDIARKQFWLIDRNGLLIQGMPDVMPFQLPYARVESERDDWPANERDLLSVIQKVKPTILVGCSTVRGAFTEEVVKTMSSLVAKPIIFPLSNPNENAEANPENIIHWSDGNALIATGSPFDPVEYKGRTITIAQCNNALAFPGIGLGIVVTKASALTDNMLWAASETISQESPARTDPLLPLLPQIKDIAELAYHVSLAVANQAIQDNVAQVAPSITLSDLIKSKIWKPYYRNICLKK